MLRGIHPEPRALAIEQQTPARSARAWIAIHRFEGNRPAEVCAALAAVAHRLEGMEFMGVILVAPDRRMA